MAFLRQSCPSMVTTSKTNKNTSHKKAHPASKTYTAGIDLHSNNLLLGVLDDSGARVKRLKLKCDLQLVLHALAPFKSQLRAVTVESTFNWYWLVDGLKEHGYPVVLANPAAIVQYDGLKHVDDTDDAFFLAELLRLGILPTGYIYDPKTRPSRDLLRRRMNLVRQRTALILSLKSLHERTLGQPLPLTKIKALDIKETGALFEHPANRMIAALEKQHIEALEESIAIIEKEVLASARGTGYFTGLKTLPGVGIILGMTIAMETGAIERFATPGDFASYCRTVDSKRLTNGRKKGENNQKCGNKYLSWAFVEAANFAKRFDENCRRWFDRKAAKKGTIIATKALACKLAKVAWHVMKSGEDYDEARMLPHLAGEKTISGEQPSARKGVGS